MKRLIVFLLFPFLKSPVQAQNLTGVWRGTFYNSRMDIIYGTNNKYEIQIDNAERALKGVTYSYQNTTFYGKASLIGMWTPITKNLIFKEEKLLEYKMSNGGDEADVSMFTCYLEYRKEGDREILEGNYTSQNYKTGADGGSGKIYLEKVTTSDFKKEDFIIKKEKEEQKQVDTPQVKKLVIKPNTIAKRPLKKPVTTAKRPATKPNTTAKRPVTKPNTTAKNPVAKPKQQVAIAKPPVKKPVPTVKPKPDVVKITPNPKLETPKNDVKPDIVKTDPPKRLLVKPVELPPVLKERQNDLVRTILTSANEIEVNLYDNGEIDGDTISVFLNGRLIASHKGLSTKPITLKIKIDEENPDQEITMVAENLGSIPPNTALMIVNAGDKRYDLRISSSNQNNAVVKFRYQSPGGAGK